MTHVCGSRQTSRRPRLSLRAVARLSIFIAASSEATTMNGM
jgi:hypothetical protein